MNKKILYIVGIVVVIALFVFSLLIFFKKPATPVNETHPLLNTTDLLNNPPLNDSKLIVATSQGNVLINNVFNGSLPTNGDYFTFYFSPDSTKWIDYEPYQQSFVLHGVSELNQAQFDHDRQELEKQLLAVLGISTSDACKLHAFTRTIGTSDPSWKFKEWPLTFCK